ncbi:MAG: hypothetical protein KC776_19845 [Myxococcales bacterium]|nr:hypothetical protein [Myxococcales bacterium]MCB9576887.1 hypothetical protein [Polyangiaceae bacterium]
MDAWFAALPVGMDFVSVLSLGELEKGTKRRRSSGDASPRVRRALAARSP